MDRRPIQPRIDPDRGSDPSAPGVDAEVFREALSHWATTVTIVAVRDEARVHATTVSSFVPVSAQPPLVLVSLGPGAQVLPFLEPGAHLTISFLAEDQARLASVFSDSFPVGPSPFPAEGDPVVEGSSTTLVCTVREVIPTEADASLVVGRVDAVHGPTGNRPLLYYLRGYRGLSADEGPDEA